MYVRNLFKAARMLGLTQQEIAARLGIRHTQVSLWARGHRPVPRQHWEALISIIAEAIPNAEATGALGDSTPGGTVRALTAVDFREMLVDWLTEVRETSGHGPSAELYNDLQQLFLTYGSMDKDTFSATIQYKDDARQRLHDLFTTGKQLIHQLDRAVPVEQRAAEAFASHLQATLEGSTAPQPPSDSAQQLRLRFRRPRNSKE